MWYNIKSFSKGNKYTTYNFTTAKRFRNSFSQCNNGMGGTMFVSEAKIKVG